MVSKTSCRLYILEPPTSPGFCSNCFLNPGNLYFTFVFHIHSTYPHSSFLMILKFLLHFEFCIILNPRTSISGMAICLTEDIPEMWLRKRIPSEKGVAQISDSFTIEMDFLRTSFLFWKVGSWFSCLLKHCRKGGSWRAELVTVRL